MNIFDEVKKLNLPLGEYIVVGSGILAAHGIREAHDIDLLVSRDIFKNLEGKGWARKTTSDGRSALTRGVYEAYTEFVCGKYKPAADELIKKAEIREGVPFLPLSELLKFKRELGREKDRKDIERIKKFLRPLKA